jgi:hypothetical protein
VDRARQATATNPAAEPIAAAPSTHAHPDFRDSLEIFCDWLKRAASVNPSRKCARNAEGAAIG